MDLEMEFDLRANDATVDTCFDVIVIGGGPAGTTAAISTALVADLSK